MHTAILPLPSGDVALRPVNAASRAQTNQAPRRFDSRTLFGAAQELRIEHYGQEYRLRQTRNGKLILTK
ncbi:MAG: hemin uptake protein HemP [Proteobacteria bacterium]|nr:hemin uptake protein HemP [Pseudomonadota bacterium]